MWVPGTIGHDTVQSFFDDKTIAPASNLPNKKHAGPDVGHRDDGDCWLGVSPRAALCRVSNYSELQSLNTLISTIVGPSVLRVRWGA